MRQFRKAAPVALLAVATLALGACAQSDRTDGGGSGASGAAASGGTMTFGAAGAPKLFDPFYATDGETFRITRQMFEGLLTDKPGTAEVVPGLAAEMPTSDDGKVWTFKLRTGVKFTDGTDFNADAVCKNFERMFDQNKAGETAAQYWTYTMGAFKSDASKSLYKGCEAVDPATVKISVNTTTSKFPVMLSLASFGMQSPTAMDKGDANNVKAQGEGFIYPDYAQAPVGTGPFKLDKYDEANKTVTLVAQRHLLGREGQARQADLQDHSRREHPASGAAGRQHRRLRPAQPGRLEGPEGRRRPAAHSTRLQHPLHGAQPREEPEAEGPAGCVRPSTWRSTATRWSRPSCPRAPRRPRSSCPTPSRATTATSRSPPTTPPRPRPCSRTAGASNLTLNFAYPTEVTRPVHAQPAEDLRGTARRPGKGRGQGQRHRQAVERRLPRPGSARTARSTPGSSAGPVTTTLPTTSSAPSSRRPPTTSTPTRCRGARRSQPPSPRPTPSSTRTSGTPRTRRSPRRSTSEYIPGLPLSSSPPALVVGPKVKGLVASPLTAEDFSTVTISK